MSAPPHVLWFARQADLSNQELEKKAQEEFIAAMEKQLQSEGVDVKGVTVRPRSRLARDGHRACKLTPSGMGACWWQNVMEEMSRRNRELFALPPWGARARLECTVDCASVSRGHSLPLFGVRCVHAQCSTSRVLSRRSRALACPSTRTTPLCRRCGCGQPRPPVAFAP
jgi:hypothetical protein